MIVTTTPTVEGYRITGYYGIVFGEAMSLSELASSSSAAAAPATRRS